NQCRAAAAFVGWRRRRRRAAAHAWRRSRGASLGARIAIVAPKRNQILAVLGRPGRTVTWLRLAATTAESTLRRASRVEERASQADFRRVGRGPDVVRCGAVRGSRRTKVRLVRDGLQRLR